MLIQSRIVGLFALAPVLWIAALCGAQVRAPAEDAALAGKWQDVIQLLGTDPTASTPPERLLAAHACLALNRSNESLCLFAGLNEADLAAWNTWTQTLAQNHDTNSIAQYLRGDALARQSQWQDADVAFDRALAINPDSVLVLNARGVLLATQEEWDAAIIDFTTAEATDADFAEAHASMGTMWIQKLDGATGALDAFDRALKASPESVLARNGRACALIQLDRWEEAEQDLTTVQEHASDCLMPVARLAASNVAELTRLATETTGLILSKVAKIDAGMTSEMVSHQLAGISSPIERGKVVAVMESAARWNASFESAVRLLKQEDPINVKTIVGMHGLQPVVELSGTAHVDRNALIKQTQDNLAFQTRNLDLAKHFEYTQPAALGLGDSLRVRIQYRDLINNNARGVSSAEIGMSRIDTGRWNTVTSYGLCYPFRPQPHPAPEPATPQTAPKP